MKARRLERSSPSWSGPGELVTPKELKDSGADVADALVRLIYFYQQTDQPFQAAVLGEHIARTLKVPGGKPALAGVMGLTGYATAAASDGRRAGAGRGPQGRPRPRPSASASSWTRSTRPTPRPTAPGTASPSLLMEEGKPVEAYDVAASRCGPGTTASTGARLLQGAVAYQLLAPADSPLADDRKKAVFRKTVAELEKTVKPEPTAGLDDIRGYVNTRCRLALMHLLQSRVDPEPRARAASSRTASTSRPRRWWRASTSTRR